jgi:microcystin-dependent protein
MPKYRVNASTFANVIGDLGQVTAETRYIRKTGGGMSGALIIPSPTAAGHAATKAYVDARLPVGVMMPFGGPTAPTGWLLCGPATNVSRTTYSALFAVIGTTYGVGDGSTTFGLPTIQARGPVGLSGDAEFDTLGEMQGSPTHTLTAGEVPNITGTIEMHNAAGPTILASASGVFSGSGGSGSTYHSHSTATAGANSYGSAVLTSQGGGGSHTNAQPYIILNYIIKY